MNLPCPIALFGSKLAGGSGMLEFLAHSLALFFFLIILYSSSRILKILVHFAFIPYHF